MGMPTSAEGGLLQGKYFIVPVPQTHEEIHKGNCKISKKHLKHNFGGGGLFFILVADHQFSSVFELLMAVFQSKYQG